MTDSGLVYELPLVRGNLDETPCHLCPAICCNYVALEIDKPNCKKDFDHLRWYLLHEKIHIFIDSGAWYLQVWNKCVHLQPDNACGIYETRPQICRDYGKDSDGRVNCHAVSKKNEEYEILFTEPEQIEKYYEKWYKKRYGKRKKAASPTKKSRKA